MIDKGRVRIFVIYRGGIVLWWGATLDIVARFTKHYLESVPKMRFLRTAHVARFRIARMIDCERNILVVFSRRKNVLDAKKAK